MKETIYNLLAQQGDMTWQQIIMHIPTIIVQKIYTVSLESFIAVRKRTIDNAPTIPSDNAILFPMTVITVPVITVRTISVTPNFLL